MPILSFFPLSFIRKVANATKARLPLEKLKSSDLTDMNNLTTAGKTYGGLLSYANNGQELCQFYVTFKGPLMVGVASGSLLIFVIQVLMKVYGRKVVQSWIEFLIPYLTGGACAFLGQALTYLQRGVWFYRMGAMIYNVGAAVINIYHGASDKMFVLVDYILVGEYVPANNTLPYKGNVTADFVALVEKAKDLK